MSYFLGSDNSDTIGTEARGSEDGRLLSVSFWWEEPLPRPVRNTGSAPQRPFALGGLLGPHCPLAEAG